MVSHTNAPWTPHYARHFQAAGHDLLIISFHPDLLDGVRVEFVGRPDFSIEHGKTLFLTRAPRVRRLLKRFAPDVVYAPYLISNGLTAALAWRGPLVVASRGADGVERLKELGFPSWAAKRLIRWICGRAGLVHAVSEEWRTAVLDAGVPANKTFVVPTGVDSEMFSPPDRREIADVPHLLCPRKNEPLYRNDLILKALGELRQRGRRFEATFAGGGTLLDDHKRLAIELGLGDVVRFTGHRPYSDLPDLYRAADVFVSASLTDGTASTLLEALSTGTFPVVTDIAANRPWITNGETGILFQPNSAEAIVNALDRAFSQPELWRRAIEPNRKLAADNDHKRTIPLLLDHLMHVAEEYKRRASK